MSSTYVRDQVKAFIGTDIPSETLVDVTGSFEELSKLLAKNSVTGKDDWLGIQFIPSEEVPISSTANNSAGRYREFGSIFLHIVTPSKFEPQDNILPRSETIRNAFRGTRINDIIIESVAPPNFEAGATLRFNGGWTAAAVIINFKRDLNL